MAHPARDSIYEALASIRLIDPHTHINPHSPASSTLADLLGYHYYTELAHSAGMPKEQIEEEGIGPRELVRRLIENLGPIENTAQYSWLIEICRTFFGFEGDRLDSSNWETVYDAAESQMALAEWPQMVLDQSNVEAVFLTNDFDDELAGFDTDTYIPCLRTDDLVFHLAKYQTRQRLEACTGITLDGTLNSLRDSLNQRFEHFVAAGARACAISLPPTFSPLPVSDGRASTALDEILRKGAVADDAHQQALSRRVFWTLAELCDQYGLPFDLMIGVNRGVYGAGVFQGQDLYDSRVSLIQYKELFNAFPKVKFPISVLASVTNQELVSYSWIFPNVLTNGHWWYSNTPSFIARDAASRLEAVPQTKQIAYYSDAYKLEFVLPKFDMYRQILAGVLAEQFVGDRGWSEQRAIELGRQVLRDNVDTVFPKPTPPEGGDTWMEETIRDEDPQATWTSGQAPGTSAALAAGAIGMVEVEPGEAGDEGLSGSNEGFSTVIETPADQLAEHDEMETIIEDSPGALSLDESDELPPLSDRPTVVEDLSDEELPLDPVPTADEIQSVGVADVELQDFASGGSMPTAETIEMEADVEPLDVGDLTGDLTGDDTADTNSDVRQLRGDTSFAPDEESLQLQANPTTGELTFPVEQEGDQASLDDQLMLDPEKTVDDTASLQETVPIEDASDIGADDLEIVEDDTDQEK